MNVSDLIVVWSPELLDEDAAVRVTASGALVLMPLWLKGTEHGEALLIETLETISDAMEPDPAA